MLHDTKGTEVPDLDTLKAQAKRLRTAMADKGTPLAQSAALETVARQWGFRDWNTLSAKAKSAPRPNADAGWQVGQRVHGRYQGHPFEGALKAVRAAQGGFWYLTVVFDTPVDVVESDAFSALRRQVNVVLGADGTTHARLSNGTPHMALFSA